MLGNSDSVRVAYSAPDGVTPALARYHTIDGYDTRTFVVAILDLVANDFLDMGAGRADGIAFRRGSAEGKPKSLPSRQLLKDILRGRDGLPVGKTAYTDWLTIRHRHARAMDWQDQTLRGTGGGTLMAGVLITVICLILMARVAMLRPYGMSALDALLPYWPVPAFLYGGLYLWRWLSRRHLPSMTAVEAQLAKYKRFLEVAKADRLDPRFMADGVHKSIDPDTLYLAAFGIRNSWADPLVQAFEDLLPGPVQSTHLYDGVDGADLSDKRGFAPRPAPRAFTPLFLMGAWFDF